MHPLSDLFWKLVSQKYTATLTSIQLKSVTSQAVLETQSKSISHAGCYFGNAIAKIWHTPSLQWYLAILDNVALLIEYYFDYINSFFYY